MKKPKTLFFDIPNGWMFFSLLACLAFIAFYNLQNKHTAATTRKMQYYSVSDFQGVPKTDGHFHYNTSDVRFLKFADSLNFRIISPNVDTGTSIDKQLEITTVIPVIRSLKLTVTRIMETL